MIRDLKMRTHVRVTHGIKGIHQVLCYQKKMRDKEASERGALKAMCEYHSKLGLTKMSPATIVSYTRGVHEDFQQQMTR